MAELDLRPTDTPISKSEASIPLAVPDLRGNEAAYLAACVRDNWVSSAGPFVSKLERRMAALTHRRGAVATVNGTAALHLALLLAGIGRGDLVVVPDWTFAATANAVYHAGAEPYFVDVTQESWTLDPKLTEQVIETAAREGQRRIAAVIAVDALGHPADLDRIGEICRRHEIFLIEDAAAAIGAHCRGKPAGSFGDAATFSFNGNKTITAGGGGMIVSDRDDWIERGRRLSTQARRGPNYVYDAVGFNYRMTNLNAAVGLAQLERLDEMVAAKRAIAARYSSAIAGREDLIPMPQADWAESACWLYSVLCPSKADAQSLIVAMAEAGIETRMFWEALADQPPYRTASRTLTGTSRSISGRVVSLPCSTAISEGEQRRVIDVLATWRAARTAAATRLA